MNKYEVQIVSVPATRARAVRALRVIGRMPLHRAIALYELASAGGDVVAAAGLDRHVAEHVVEQLEAGGVRARAVESAARVPMVADPNVNRIYRWGPLRMLRRLSNG